MPTHSLEFSGNPTPEQYVNQIKINQALNPNVECFAQLYVEGLGWRLISMKTMKEYTPESYFAEFGEMPDLSEPTPQKKKCKQSWMDLNKN